MPSLQHFQIIIDIAFFIVIMLLLHQLNKRMARTPGCDDATVGEFKKLMVESQDSADLFLRTVQESQEKLNNLVRQLDSREKRVVILIEEAESLIQKMTSLKTKAESGGTDGEKYRQIIRMVQEGLSREEVAERIGVSRGEIDLIVELEQTREEHQ